MTSRAAMPLFAAALLAAAPMAIAQTAPGSTAPGATRNQTTVDVAGLRNGLLVSRLDDADVYGAEDREIGEIEDIVLMPDGTRPVAILSVGGFLGVGERHVAVPLAQLQRNDSNGRWSLPGATQDSLKAMPEVNLSELRRDRAPRDGGTTGSNTRMPGGQGNTTGGGMTGGPAPGTGTGQPAR